MIYPSTARRFRHAARRINRSRPAPHRRMTTRRYSHRYISPVQRARTLFYSSGSILDSGFLFIAASRLAIDSSLMQHVPFEDSAQGPSWKLAGHNPGLDIHGNFSIPDIRHGNVAERACGSTYESRSRESGLFQAYYRSVLLLSGRKQLTYLRIFNGSIRPGQTTGRSSRARRRAGRCRRPPASRCRIR